MANLSEALGGALSSELLTELTTMVSQRRYEATAPNTVTTGALGVTSRSTFVSVTSTKAYTLADGAWEGQRKTIRVTVAADTPNGTLTPANPSGYTSITLDAVNEEVELEWHADGWMVVFVVGATVNA